MHIEVHRLLLVNYTIYIIEQLHGYTAVLGIEFCVFIIIDPIWLQMRSDRPPLILKRRKIWGYSLETCLYRTFLSTVAL